MLDRTLWLVLTALALTACENTTGSDDADSGGGSRDDEPCDAEWYQDQDGDGYGGANNVSGCEAPGPDWIAAGGDCDDADDAVYIGADDTVGNAVDDNCDGVDGVDEDGDGFASVESGGDDCDDAEAGANPAVSGDQA